MKELFKKIFLNLDEILGCILLSSVVLVTALNVFLRYVFGFVIVPAEELVLLLFTWTVYVGIAVGYRKESHIAIDAIYILLPQFVRKILDVVVDLIVLMCSLYITYLSVILFMNSGVKRTPILMLSYYFVNSSLIVGFGLSTIYNVIKLFRTIKGVCQKKPLAY